MGLAKWIIGGLGWATFGPIGGLLGFFVGSVIDSSKKMPQTGPHESSTTPQDFHISLMVLIAAVMKADGSVVKHELNFVKRYLVQQHGEEKAAEYLIVLRDLLSKEIPLHDVCLQIAHNTTYSTRLQLLHLLFGIANSDGYAGSDEIRIIQQISSYLNISTSDYKSIHAMFIKDTSSSYTILGITPQATNEEVKKAYREMAKKHHPDLVSTLGKDVQDKAKEKFQEIQSAYDSIKKERGM